VEYCDRLVPSRAGTSTKEALARRGLENQGPAFGSKAMDEDEDSDMEDPAKARPSRSRHLDLLRQGLFPDESPHLFRYKSTSRPLQSSGLLLPRSSVPEESRAPDPQRPFSHQPFRVLSAPGLQDDFYSSPLDFSHSDVLAVGLGSCVDLWSLRTCSASRLCQFHPAASVSSVKWAGSAGSAAPYLALGMHSGEIKLWDAASGRELRRMAGHCGRVGALTWDGSSLFTGGMDGRILHRDVRVPSHYIGVLGAHDQEVCGLTWSPESQQLASGGNEGSVCVWNSRNSVLERRFDGHQAGVKALAWSPHERGLLASGGGSSDRCIRTWNTLNGASISCTGTDSQVCTLHWSEGADELLSSHGYWGNEIILWKRKGMSKVAVLSAHRRRAVHVALAHDGQTFVTGTGDEILRFWKLCPGPRLRRGEKPLQTSSRLLRTIR
jgi:cell division cycle 20-like protein 1 (cofactor of APC complex)